MAQLHIKINSRWGEAASYQPLLPDETVSSWVTRHVGLELITDDREHGERAFGTLTVALPGATPSLLKALHRAAEPPDPWLLRPLQRTLICLRCQTEDWSQGVPDYERRAWSVAWRTCCPRHGQLFDTDHKAAPTWPKTLLAPPWSGDEVVLVLKRPFHVLFALELRGDRRAIHLETALGEGKRQGVWFPRGLSASALRELYQAIVLDLLSQIHLKCEESAEERPAPDFNRQLNGTRFSLNVLAEAILSEWTQTPLPDSAASRRTALMVRAIGWGAERPPSQRPAQVLFRAPLGREFDLTRYGALLPKRYFQQLTNVTQDPHRGWFTLAEARYLDLDISDALTWLGKLTRRGQFLAFNPRAGTLVRNPHLPGSSRLQPDTALSKGLSLPEWALGPPPAPRFMDPEDFMFFQPHTPEWLLREKSRGRRMDRRLRASVRFTPVSVEDPGSVLRAVQRLRATYGDHAVSVLLGSGKMPPLDPSK